MTKCCGGSKDRGDDTESRPLLQDKARVKQAALLHRKQHEDFETGTKYSAVAVLVLLCLGCAGTAISSMVTLAVVLGCVAVGWALWMVMARYSSMWLGQVVIDEIHALDRRYLGVEVNIDECRANLLTGTLIFKGVTITNPRGYESDHIVTGEFLLVDISSWTFLRSWGEQIVVERFLLTEVDVMLEYASHGCWGEISNIQWLIDFLYGIEHPVPGEAKNAQEPDAPPAPVDTPVPASCTLCGSERKAYDRDSSALALPCSCCGGPRQNDKEMPSAVLPCGLCGERRDDEDSDGSLGLFCCCAASRDKEVRNQPLVCSILARCFGRDPDGDGDGRLCDNAWLDANLCGQEEPGLVLGMPVKFVHIVNIRAHGRNKLGQVTVDAADIHYDDFTAENGSVSLRDIVKMVIAGILAGSSSLSFN